MRRTLRALRLSLGFVLVAGCAVTPREAPPSKAEVVQRVFPSVMELVYVRAVEIRRFLRDRGFAGLLPD